jgi:DNA-directed RNA polymerase specialized sigma24 family protein
VTKKIVNVTYSHEKQRESSIWLYRIIERTMMDRLLKDDLRLTSILLSESLKEFENEGLSKLELSDDGTSSK